MPRGIPNPTSAKSRPVIANAGLETAELPVGRTERTAPTEANPLGEPKLVAVAERLPDQEKLANLAFMNEMVTIRPATSTDKNAEQIFEITVNGRVHLFKRGEQKTVPRYVVDHMARMKVTALRQREATAPDGDRQILNEYDTAVKYDFAMIRDENPLGESWLRATLAMGG